MNFFEINENTQDALANAPIPTGINENVDFVSAVMEPLKEGGDPVLQYNFTDSEGRELSHKMWEPDPQRIKENAEAYPKEHSRNVPAMGFVKGEPVTPEQAVIIAGQEFQAYNKHILKRIVDEKALVEKMKGVSDYADFGNRVVELTKEAGLPVKVRLKVVLDYNEKYHVLPKKHYEPFIEPMTVPKENSSLKITQYDKVKLTTAESADNPDDFNAGMFEQPGF